LERSRSQPMPPSRPPRRVGADEPLPVAGGAPERRCHVEPESAARSSAAGQGSGRPFTHRRRWALHRDLLRLLSLFPTSIDVTPCNFQFQDVNRKNN
jgi:hypothetical protein